MGITPRFDLKCMGMGAAGDFPGRKRGLKTRGAKKKENAGVTKIEILFQIKFYKRFYLNFT